MVDIARSQTKKLAKKVSPTAILGIICASSVGVALLAIFVLAGWAEASVLNHGLQHVLIFVAGLGFGTSMLGIYQTKGRNKHEG